MSPPPLSFRPPPISFPRVSGDEPTNTTTKYTLAGFSPRERG